MDPNILKAYNIRVTINPYENIFSIATLDDTISPVQCDTYAITKDTKEKSTRDTILPTGQPCYQTVLLNLKLPPDTRHNNR